jgi:hypothetical protein
MEAPLYEFDQVITCPELSDVSNQLMFNYEITPKWRFIERFKIRIQLGTVNWLHEALHLKTQQVRGYKENPNE